MQPRFFVAVILSLMAASACNTAATREELCQAYIGAQMSTELGVWSKVSTATGALDDAAKRLPRDLEQQGMAGARQFGSGISSVVWYQRQNGDLGACTLNDDARCAIGFFVYHAAAINLPPGEYRASFSCGPL